MISEFQQLAKKIDQLAALVQATRSENADLRCQLAEAVASNDELRGRIQEAHERVSTVLQHEPFAEQESE